MVSGAIKRYGVHFEDNFREQDNFTPEVTHQVAPEVTKIISILEGDINTKDGISMSRKQIQLALGLKDEKHFREAYLKPALAGGFVEMTIPDKPNSRLQKYRLTPKGVQLHLCLLI
ncbi:MAG: hypothetical protein HQK72_08215 [Desulfamplus sp.]|nr:hypothetical protein [Desulfamplus sp.]